MAYQVRATDTRLRGSYGTGFKAPTANQLYTQSVSSFGPFSGNPNLTPETSRGWELGADQPLLAEAVRVGLTYYRNRISDLIVFTDDFASLENVSSVDTSGIESYVHWDMSERFSAQLDYAHTHAQDRSSGEELRRRPMNKATLGLDYQATSKLGLHVETIYIGERYDTDAVNFSRILRPSYVLTNIAAQYQIDDRWQYFPARHQPVRPRLRRAGWLRTARHRRLYWRETGALGTDHHDGATEQCIHDRRSGHYRAIRLQACAVTATVTDVLADPARGRDRLVAGRSRRDRRTHDGGAGRCASAA